MNKREGSEPIRVLVVGSGGREHALATRLAACASVAEVLVAPGNGGAAPRVRNAKPASPARSELVKLALEAGVGLTIVGPEAPLVDGLADEMRAHGIPTFGPGKAAAQLEGSKAFMKELCRKQGIPTAPFAVFTEEAPALEYIRTAGRPLVVKADGLCAGKGVVVAASVEEAQQAARSMLRGEAFGDAGRTIVIEDRLEGTEASVHALCVGTDFIVLPAVQDHKRIGDGDRGPNTGGMGAYGPAPVITKELEARVARECIAPVLQGLAEAGAPFVGVLFAGLMIAPSGEPWVLEYNVRFGDPETEVLMDLMEGDLALFLSRAAAGTLDRQVLVRAPRHSMAVVLAAAGYPGTPRTGDVIVGIEEAEALPGVRVLHAGTRRDGGQVVTAGGRVLVVTSTGATLREARDRVYQAVDRIKFEGMQFRRDIGYRALT